MSQYLPVGTAPSRLMYTGRPDHQEAVILYISLPTDGFKDAERIEDDTRLLLNQIETKERVSINTTEMGVTIVGGTKSSVAAAKDLVYDVLKCRPGEGSLWHPKILIDPRCWLQGQDRVRFDFSGHTNNGARAVLCSDSTTAGPVSTRVSDSDALAPYHKAFRAEFESIFGNLRYLSTRMRMRVVYGSFRLEEWKKGKQEYSRDEFEQTAKKTGKRGTCHMDKLIGDAESAAKLLNKILQAPDRFGPVDARVASLDKVVPAHKLIIVLPGLDLEVEVMSVRTARNGATRSWQLGALLGYRRERRGRQAAVITACPQLSFDWVLEVKSHVPQERIPFSHSELVKNIKMTTCATDEYAFPKIELSKPFASLHKIEAILAKTTSSFNMGNSPYNLDVSVYRRWKTNTLARPAMGVGVEVYGDDWDMTMKETELAGRPRDWEGDLSGFFPDDYSSEMKHMDAFFSYVHGIQDWLEGIPGLRREKDEAN